MPTSAGCAGIDDMTWATIRRALGWQGEHQVRGATVVNGPAGAPIYVVVVEPSVDSLPGIPAIRRRYGVTQREAEVALLAARRLPVGEMAAALGVTTHTIRRHVERVLEKLRVARRQDVRAVLLELAQREREDAACAEQADRLRRARRLQTAAA